MPERETPQASSGGLQQAAVHQLRLFFVALQFFTRLPVPRWVGFQTEWLQHAARYFPLVGWLVAWISAAVYVAATQFWPQPVAVLLSTAAGIYLTGAFHEDGFADVCDGLGGGMSTARALDIMRDSRIGAYGAIGIGVLLLVKLAALNALLPFQILAALGIAHPLSRCLAAALIWRLDYVREEGKVKPLAQQMSGKEFFIALLTALLPIAGVIALGMMSWQRVLLGVLLALLAAYWLARKFVRRLGGYTGDCLGAVQQLSEVAFYLGALAAVPAFLQFA
ncbi:adenosylcobinamide-GDP ribazoletransferase [Herbaspirillum lusitanum]|uniref:Adenosylcobinamide-GDP ribazoletransferase n=1 Tax=Herbaspirillum lusitanum TaxID=213312 RepID=A0ABW9A6E9_9BURK